MRRLAVLAASTAALAAWAAPVRAQTNRLDTPTGPVGRLEDNRITSKLSITTRMFENVSARFAFEARYDSAPAPRPPFALPYAEGFQPLAEPLDTKTEAALIINFL